MNEHERNAIIGARIMQRRKRLGMKQSELAELINVSDNQISNIENGRSFPRLNSFIMICSALNCTSDYLISGVMHEACDSNIIDMISSLSIEEQKNIWKLIDCYIHRNDNTMI